MRAHWTASRRKIRPSRFDRAALAPAIGAGLLSFPVTHFASGYAFDEDRYREDIQWLLQHKPAGLFAAGGTGEFFSLTPREFARVVSAAVQETAGRVPMLAGCGCGTAMAIEFARAAEAAGADALLLLPPYLVNAEQAGMVVHAEAVCKATNLGVIVYHCDNFMLNDESVEILCERCPNLIRFKDGVGDIELTKVTYARLGERLVYVGVCRQWNLSRCLISRWDLQPILLRFITFCPISRRSFMPPCAGGTVRRYTVSCASSFFRISQCAIGARYTRCRL